MADTNDHDDEFAVVNGVDVVVADADAVAVGGPDSLATPCGRGLSGSDLIESLMSFCSTRGSLPSDFAALVVILSSYPLMIVSTNVDHIGEAIVDHIRGPSNGSQSSPRTAARRPRRSSASARLPKGYSVDLDGQRHQLGVRWHPRRIGGHRVRLAPAHEHADALGGGSQKIPVGHGSGWVKCVSVPIRGSRIGKPAGCGAAQGNRTPDLFITSELLYRLS